MKYLHKNNATSTLAGGLGDDSVADVVLTVAGSEGEKFPDPGVGEGFYVTVVDEMKNYEVCLCTSRSGDSLTVVRGQCGTSVQAWDAGDKVENRVTAEAMADKVDTDDFDAAIAGQSDDLETHKTSNDHDGEYYNKAAVDALLNALNSVPTATIFPFGGDNTTIPDGYLFCDGQAVSRTEYSDLFDVIGEVWGEGDGSTTFNVPDLRNEFIRGADPEGTRPVGHGEIDILKSHSHEASAAASGNHDHGGNTGSDTHSHGSGNKTGAAGGHGHDCRLSAPGSTGNNSINDSAAADGAWATGSNFIEPVGNHQHSIASDTHSHTISNSGTHSHSITIENTGSSETRPKNHAVLFIIKT